MTRSSAWGAAFAETLLVSVFDGPGDRCRSGPLRAARCAALAAPAVPGRLALLPRRLEDARRGGGDVVALLRGDSGLEAFSRNPSDVASRLGLSTGRGTKCPNQWFLSY